MTARAEFLGSWLVVYRLYHKIKCQGLSDFGILCKWKRSYGLRFVNYTKLKIIKALSKKRDF